MKIRLLIFVSITFFMFYYPKLIKDDGIYQINNLEYFYTSGYGINEDVSYKINCDNKCILTIKEYGKAENEVIKVKLDSENMEKFVSILNKDNVLSWDGFSKSNKNVLDGNSFNFRLRYNDDEKLSANGYMMYPNHYKDFKNEFENYVNKLKK